MIGTIHFNNRVAFSIMQEFGKTLSFRGGHVRIYVGTNDQRIYRLNAETGVVISELALEAKPVGRLAIGNDSLFVFLENSSERVGYIVSVDPSWLACAEAEIIAGLSLRASSSMEGICRRRKLSW
jgi:hypothetical protein